MILIGTSVHNFCDGIVIAAAFLADTDARRRRDGRDRRARGAAAGRRLRRARAFGLRAQRGRSPTTSRSGVATLAGALAGYFALADMQQVLPTVLAIAAASLLYVAVADLIPSLHRRPEPLETAQAAGADRARHRRHRGRARRARALTRGTRARSRDARHRASGAAYVASAHAAVRRRELAARWQRSAAMGALVDAAPHRPAGAPLPARIAMRAAAPLPARRRRSAGARRAQRAVPARAARRCGRGASARCADGPPAAVARGRRSRAGDRRFAAREWRELPYFALLKQSYLLDGDYLTELAALAPLPAARQAPARVPDAAVRRRARADQFRRDQSRGARARARDRRREPRAGAREPRRRRRSKGRISMTDERAFEVGRNLAVTPGSVVFRNELIELIQYAPTTRDACTSARWSSCRRASTSTTSSTCSRRTRSSATRSAQGHTVFMVSWRNIPPELGALTWDDYLERRRARGDRASRRRSPAARPSTRSASASAARCSRARSRCSRRAATAASRARRSSRRCSTSPIPARSASTSRASSSRRASRRCWPASACTAASSPARSRACARTTSSGTTSSATTSRARRRRRSTCSTGTATRPTCRGRCTSYYLRNMYLDNRLREPGALTMAGEPVDLGRVDDAGLRLRLARRPHRAVALGLPDDARSLGGDATFVLGASGHIAGVVNPPAKNRRNYWTNELAAPTTPTTGSRAREPHPGSWWPHWGAWLAPHGGAMRAGAASAGQRARTRRSSRRPGATCASRRLSRRRRVATGAADVRRATPPACANIDRSRAARRRNSAGATAVIARGERTCQ